MTHTSQLDRPLNLSSLDKTPSYWPASSWPYVVTAVLLAVIFLGSPNFQTVRSPQGSPYAGDFLQEWIAGRMLREGDRTRFYDPEYAKDWEHRVDVVGIEFKSDDYFPLVYPPFYYGLVTPLSYLPFPTAVLVWLALITIAYLAAWQLFMRMDFVGEQKLVWLLPLSLLFVPLIESLTSCQKGTVLLFILTATYALLARGQSFWAGVVFGLIAFKPQFALPIAIAMLCKQQWRFVLGGLTTGLILGGGCLLMGFDLCSQYVTFSRHATDYIQNGGYDLTKSHAFYGFFTLLVGHGEVTPLVKILTLLAMFSTVGLLAFALRGPLQTQNNRFQNQFSLLVLSTILLSPHVYTYDLTILLLPLGFLAQQAFTARANQTQPLLTTLGLLLFISPGLSPQLAAFSGLQITVPLMLGLMLGLYRERRVD